MEDPANPAVSDATLWAGVYGIQYTTKFNVEWRDRIPVMQEIIKLTGARSILDVGTNAAWNLRALREVDETLELAGVEINEHVALTAASMGFTIHVGDAGAVGEAFREQFDLVITSGLLIHIPTIELDAVMRSVAAASNQWVLAIEYEAPSEAVTVKHGEVERTWARPYGAMYEAQGLTQRVMGRALPGYPKCTLWLMEKT